MAGIECQILTSATQVFQSSLEMKENVDFLLTPAFYNYITGYSYNLTIPVAGSVENLHLIASVPCRAHT
jgi:hypothetical protein